MSSWRQTTKHIVCPAAAHLPIHIPPVPKAATKPLSMSLSLPCCPLEIQQTALWSTNYIFFFHWLCFISFICFFFLSPPKLKQITYCFPLYFLCSYPPLSPPQCMLVGAQLIYQLFMLVAAHYTDRATCLPSVD